MSFRYYVAAYASSPSCHHWEPEKESIYFQSIVEHSAVIGIEHPYLMHSEKYPLHWLKENIPDHWSLILTTLPTFMEAGRSNPGLGLASNNEKERVLAVEIMQKCIDYAHELRDVFGRNIVKAIHFHSAPRNIDNECRSHREAFKGSLRDLKAMDWGSTELNLEHCDAYLTNQIPEKGFLLLEEEIAAIKEIGGFGMVLNWARSAIETRSKAGPLLHLQMIKNANLLKGFFFSGCTDKLQSEYGAWKDTHMPPALIVPSDHLCSESLLDEEEMAKIFSLLNNESYLGIKVANLTKEKTLEKCVGLNTDTIRALEHVAFKVKGA